MTEELRNKIAALRAIAPELNAATDEASAVMRKVENLLGQELSIGVSAETREFDSRSGTDDDGATTLTIWTLGYGRIGGSYRVHVVEETGLTDHEGDWVRTIEREETTWSSCPREIKLKSYAKLPELLDGIADKASEIAAESRKTSLTVQEVMDAMGESPAPSAEKKDEPEPTSAKTKLRATPTLPRRPAT